MKDADWLAGGAPSTNSALYGPCSPVENHLYAYALGIICANEFSRCFIGPFSGGGFVNKLFIIEGSGVVAAEAKGQRKNNISPN